MLGEFILKVATFQLDTLNPRDLDWAWCQPKRLWGRGGGGQNALGYFKSDDDETWHGYSMSRNLYKFTKIFGDVIAMLIL